MKSIKPGRGPSAMGAIGSVAVGVFGIVWTIAAASMGAPVFFVLFGIVFVGLAVIQGIYHLKNATGANRMSLFDITENNEEPDPLDRFHMESSNRKRNSFADNQNHDEVNYCPFCGHKVSDASYRFCPKCGKEVRK
ncbi:zinc-ribbon domain-containing protein [Paenibacillus sp. GYB003]|uniref:zinc-ribbon domain-containing protein n=1 Tax=Paenibacillus sp. GYB003 TaxID=2994392 RepID=UPI002F967BFA